MYKILDKTQFSEKVFKFRIEAPAMAKHAHAGQFLICLLYTSRCV